MTKSRSHIYDQVELKDLPPPINRLKIIWNTLHMYTYKCISIFNQSQTAQ